MLLKEPDEAEDYHFDYSNINDHVPGGVLANKEKNKGEGGGEADADEEDTGGGRMITKLLGVYGMRHSIARANVLTWELVMMKREDEV